MQIALVNDKWTCSAVNPDRVPPLKNSPCDVMLTVLAELVTGNQAAETDGGGGQGQRSSLDACVDRGLCPGQHPQEPRNVLLQNASGSGPHREHRLQGGLLMAGLTTTRNNVTQLLVYLILNDTGNDHSSKINDLRDDTHLTKKSIHIPK